MTQEHIQQIIDRITYKPEWEFHIFPKGDGFLIQIRFVAADNITGKNEMQYCRKWYVSSHAVENEVVTTVFKAIIAAEEHEIKEKFKFDRVMIFNPHLDYTELAKVLRKVSEDHRTTV